MLLVPSNIPWDAFPKDDKWKYEVVLNYLLLSSIYARYNDNAFDKYRIKISSEMWRIMIGGDYNKVLQHLEELDIISRGKNYQNKGFPKDVWLKPEFKTPTTIPLNPVTAYKIDSFTKRRFERQISQSTKKSGISPDIYHNLEKIIRSRLVIDATAEEKRECGKLVLRSKQGKISKRVRKYDIDLLNALDNHSEDTDIHFSVGEQSYRFYSPLTQLCSVPRGFLRGDSGSILHELDIQCSQPTFLLIAAIRHFGNPQFFSKWVDIIQTGDLYQYLADGIGADGRNHLKENYLFRTLYGVVDENDILYQFIKRDCPHFAQFIFEKKNGYSKRKQDYAQLAISAQQTEALFILGNIVRQIFEQDPHIFLLTIHDSIISTQENIQWIKDLMTHEFRKLGVCPILKEKTLLYANTKSGWTEYH